MDHTRVISENHHILLRCTNVNEQIISSLEAGNGLDEDRASRIEKDTGDVRKQCGMLYKWMKKDKKLYKCFLEVMKENRQEHVANLLEGNLNGLHVPLCDENYYRLKEIKPKLWKMIIINETLMSTLKSKNALSDTDYQDIDGKQEPYKKGHELVKTVMRRSEYSFQCLEESLNETYQPHAAKYLRKGLAIEVHANTNSLEDEIPLSEMINEAVSGNSSSEDSGIAELNDQGIHLVAAKPDHSILLLFYCKTTDQVKKFTKTYNSGRLSEILKVFFNRLLNSKKKAEILCKKELAISLSLYEDEVVLIEEFAGLYNWTPRKFCIEDPVYKIEPEHSQAKSTYTISEEVITEQQDLKRSIATAQEHMESQVEEVSTTVYMNISDPISSVASGDSDVEERNSLLGFVITDFDNFTEFDTDEFSESIEKKSEMAIEMTEHIYVRGWNALQLAVAGTMPQMTNSERSAKVEIILKSGEYDAKTLTFSSQSLLHLLCLRPLDGSQCDSDENYKIAKVLIDNDVDINHKDERGDTALMLACRNGYTSVVEALVNLKWMELDVDSVDSSGETALTLAARNKNAKAFNRLTYALFMQSVKKEDPKVVNRFLNNSAIDDARSFEILCVKRIDRKFTLNIVASDVDRPSGSCIGFNDWLNAICIVDDSSSMYDLLFKFDKIVSGVTSDGHTALHLAMLPCQSKFGHSGLKTVGILLRSEIFDVNALTNNLETVLHFACRYPIFGKSSQKELEHILREIWNQKVNVNQRNSLGQTALMIACIYDNVVAVRELLKWKDAKGLVLDVNANDNYGHTALSIAKRSNNTAMVAMIEETRFLRAIENNDMETVKRFFSTVPRSERALEILCCKSETSIDCSNWNESNRLFTDDIPNEGAMKLQVTSNDFMRHSVWLEAVCIAYFKSNDDKSYNDILKLLLDDGRCMKGFNTEGQTVLHSAVIECVENECDSKSLQKIEILLKSRHCNVNALNSRKETVLHLVCRLASHKNLEIDDLLKILLKHRVQLNQRNIDGKAALTIACEKGNVDIVRTLLKLTGNDEIYHDINTADKSNTDQNDDEIGLSVQFKSGTLGSEEKHFDILDIHDMQLIGNNDIYAYDLDDPLNEYEGFVRNRNLKAKTKKWKSIYAFDFETWLEAAYVAIENSSDEILNLLFDYDAVVRSQKGNAGEPFLTRLLRPCTYNRQLTERRGIVKPKVKGTLQQQFGVKILEYNDITVHSLLASKNKAPLKVTSKHFCPVMPLSSCDQLNDNFSRKHLKLIENLVESGKINVNAMDFAAQTVLHTLCRLNQCGVDQIYEVTKLLIRHGAELNQKDKVGRTPLKCSSGMKYTFMIEVILNWAKETDTWLDLDAKDFNGRTALMNAAMWKRPGHVEILLNAGASVNLSDNRGFTALHHALYEIISDNLWNKEPHKSYKRNRSKLNEDKIKTVELLLERPDIDVNALDCEGYSPLDIAETSIKDIPLEIREALKQKGAVSNIFLTQKQQTQSNTDSNSKMCRLYRQGRSINFLTEKCKRINNRDVNRSSSALINEKTQKSKDKGGTCMIEKLKISQGKRKLLIYPDQAAKIIKKAMSHIDELDPIFLPNGKVEIRKKSLILDNKAKWNEDFNPNTITEQLWAEGDYAFRHPSVKKIEEEVKAFIEDLASAIKRRDFQFEVRPLLVGSSYEETKLGVPDEFGFKFVLVKFSQLCEVSHSPELPTGYVRLKREQRKEGQEEKREFDSYFNEDGIFITEKIKTRFKVLVNDVLTDIQFTESQRNFDWDCNLRNDWLALVKHDFESITSLKLRRTKCGLDISKYRDIIFDISIDIAPCIHIDGWWPDEAITNVSEDIKAMGCHFVFDYPQRFYPWVPFSESCVRISFAPAESEMIKRSPDEAKQAYMIGKQLMKNSGLDFVRCYTDQILKNSYLYCIEVFTGTFETASELGLSRDKLKSKFDGTDRHLWLESLMKCHLDFVLQDFCPCYIMPTFFFPVGKFVKEFNMKCLTDDDYELPEIIFVAYKLYSIVSLQASDFKFELPSPNPVFEHFDRKAMIADLTKYVLEILERSSADDVHYRSRNVVLAKHRKLKNPKNKDALWKLFKSFTK